MTMAEAYVGKGFGNDAERFVCNYLCMLCAVADDVGGGLLIEKIEGFGRNKSSLDTQEQSTLHAKVPTPVAHFPCGVTNEAAACWSVPHLPAL
jgi:hypothetical protein